MSEKQKNLSRKKQKREKSGLFEGLWNKEEIFCYLFLGNLFYPLKCKWPRSIKIAIFPLKKDQLGKWQCLSLVCPVCIFLCEKILLWQKCFAHSLCFFLSTVINFAVKSSWNGLGERKRKLTMQIGCSHVEKTIIFIFTLFHSIFMNRVLKMPTKRLVFNLHFCLLQMH